MWEELEVKEEVSTLNYDCFRRQRITECTDRKGGCRKISEEGHVRYCEAECSV